MTHYMLVMLAECLKTMRLALTANKTGQICGIENCEGARRDGCTVGLTKSTIRSGRQLQGTV